MSDITKCTGEGCPLRDNCYRHTAKESTLQSYFIDIPFEIKDGKLSCDMYWGETQNKILNMLKNITNGEDNN
jgi:hypothetical protein